MLIRLKMLLGLASLLALVAFGGCVAETGDIEGNARGGDRTEVNLGSLTVSLNVAGDVELPDGVEASDFECVLVSDDGEEVTATFEEVGDGQFEIVVEELDAEQSWTLNIEAPPEVEIDQPSQEVTIVAGEMKNVDITITNVMAEE